MEEVRGNLRYTKEHEWALIDGKKAVIGITKQASDALGDVVYIQLPAVGKSYKQMDTLGVIESVKAASDLYCPLSGTVVKTNEALNSEPELLNKAPYDDGWICEIEIEDETEIDNLLTADEYKEFLKTL